MSFVPLAEKGSMISIDTIQLVSALLMVLWLVAIFIIARGGFTYKNGFILPGVSYRKSPT